MRRIARRMQVTQTDTLEQYLAYLRDHGDEAQALFNDLLISVTSFFRDPDAYRELAGQVIPALFDARAGGSPVRVWVAGCATGEEAYSDRHPVAGGGDAARGSGPTSSCSPPTSTRRRWRRPERAATRPRLPPTSARIG